CVIGIEEKHAEPDKSVRSERGRKLTQIRAAITLFIELNLSRFVFADKNEIGEILRLDCSRISVRVEVLMLDVLRRHEFIEIVDPFQRARLRPLQHSVKRACHIGSDDVFFRVDIWRSPRTNQNWRRGRRRWSSGRWSRAHTR